MATIVNDVRFALRFLRVNAGFTTTAVVVIALSIALSASLFAVVKGTLLNPWPYDGYDRIVTVRGDFPEQGRTQFALWSAREVEELRAQGDIFDGVIAGTAGNINLTFNDRPERVRAARITPNAFAMLGVPASLGRVLNEDDARPGARPVVVISHDFWMRQLNGQSIEGQTLRIRDTRYDIVGVMPEQFKFWDRKIWLPLTLDPNTARTQRDLSVQAKLKPSVTVAAAEARLAVITSEWHERFPDVAEYRGVAIRLLPLVDAVLRDLRPVLSLLMYAVCGVLIASASNVANAMLAKSLMREGELATRRALGATAPQMARQLVVESVLISLVGGFTGVALASFLLPQILSRIPYGFVPAEATVALDGWILTAAVGVAIACGLTSAAVPAIRAAVIDPAILLRSAGSRTTTGRPHRMRALLIGMQLTVAVVVVGFALTALMTTYRTMSRDPGFQADGIWTARIALAAAAPADRALIYKRIIMQLGQTSGLENAAIASSFPVTELPRTLVSPTPLTMGQGIDADIAATTPEFFSMLRMPLIDGRVFTAFDDERADRVAVITKALANRLWPSGNAVGSRMFIGNGDAVTIVGVVGDVISNAADLRVRYTIFRPLLQQPPTEAVVGANTDSLMALTGAIAKIDPQIPVFEAAYLRDTRAAAIGPQLLAVLLLAMFGGVVLVLSAIGLYAIVSQSMVERLREMSIRVTFGAQPRRLLVSELMRGSKLIAISAAVGAFAAFLGTPLLSPMAAGSAIFPIAVAALAVTLIAIVATAIPTYQVLASLSHPTRQ